MYWYDFCTVPRWNREIIATIGDRRTRRRVACPPACDACPYSSSGRPMAIADRQERRTLFWRLGNDLGAGLAD
jgi:hypothetical protein